MTVSSDTQGLGGIKGPQTTAEKIADLQRRRQEAQAPMGERAYDKVHDAGRLTARERLDYLSLIHI